MKIKTDHRLPLNECLGMTDEEYNQWSKDLQIMCVDRLAETGKLDHVAVAQYLLEEIRHKHLGKTKHEFSAYELELFVAGMIMRYLLLPDVAKSIQVAAYVKNMSEGLNDV